MQIDELQIKKDKVLQMLRPTIKELTISEPEATRKLVRNRKRVMRGKRTNKEKGEKNDQEKVEAQELGTGRTKVARGVVNNNEEMMDDDLDLTHDQVIGIEADLGFVDIVEQRVPKCPEGHVLKRSRFGVELEDRAETVYVCDECAYDSKPGSGEDVWRCKACDFDLCQNCVKKNLTISEN